METNIYINFENVEALNKTTAAVEFLKRFRDTSVFSCWKSLDVFYSAYSNSKILTLLSGAEFYYITTQFDK